MAPAEGTRSSSLLAFDRARRVTGREGWATYRQLFALCCASYVGMWGSVARRPAQLLTLLRHTLEDLPSLRSRWSIVWGPAVARSPLSHSNTQMLFIARDALDPSTLVVVVRGTNCFSLSSVLALDDIFRQRRWPYAAPGSPAGRISAGSARALQTLLRLRPAAGLPGAHQSVTDFLAQSIHTGDLRVITSGHSFGGTLAILLALALEDTKPVWAGFGIDVGSAAFGNPPIGDREMAAYCDERLPGRILRIHNNLDVTVRTCNDRHEAQSVATLFAPRIRSPLAWIGVSCFLAMQHVCRVQYYRGGGGRLDLDSQVDARRRSFIGQWMWQHTQGYVRALDLQHELDVWRLLAKRGR